MDALVLPSRSASGRDRDRSPRGEPGRGAEGRRLHQLLDLGRFLYETDCADRAVARRALEALDPDSPLVVVGSQVLFRFAYRVAASGDPAVLPTLDRIVTSRRRAVYVLAHALEVDPALQGVFLSGSHSLAAADHVVARLEHDESNRDLLLAILSWIGRPEHVPAVAAIARVDGDETTIKRIVAFAMIVGGSAGRRAVLDLPTANLSPEASAYLDEIRDEVEATEWPEQALASADIERLPDDELRARLSAMVTNGGRDDTLDPRSLLVGSLPNQELLDRLASIRVAMLGRLSDEALEDVQVTNRFFNLITYRPEPTSR